MSQLLLPLFPADSQYLTPNIAVYVYYLHCGMPIYSHHKNDLLKFRNVTSSLLLQGLCKNGDIVEVFHIWEHDAKNENIKEMNEVVDMFDRHQSGIINAINLLFIFLQMEYLH